MTFAGLVGLALARSSVPWQSNSSDKKSDHSGRVCTDICRPHCLGVCISMYICTVYIIYIYYIHIISLHSFAFCFDRSSGAIRQVLPRREQRFGTATTGRSTSSGGYCGYRGYRYRGCTRMICDDMMMYIYVCVLPILYIRSWCTSEYFFCVTWPSQALPTIVEDWVFYIDLVIRMIE